VELRLTMMRAGHLREGKGCAWMRGDEHLAAPPPPAGSLTAALFLGACGGVANNGPDPSEGSNSRAEWGALEGSDFFSGGQKQRHPAAALLRSELA